MRDYIIGIDIGASKICAAVGKVDIQGKLEILGITSVKCNGIKKSVVVDVEATGNAIKLCREKLEELTGLEITEAYLCFPAGLCELIPTKGVISITSESKKIADKDISRVLNSSQIISIPSDKEIINVIPIKYTVDDYTEVKDPIGIEATKLEVDAIAAIASTVSVDNLSQSMAAAGIKILDIKMKPLAQISIFHEIEGNDNNYIGVIDIGADTIDLGIYKGGNICYTQLIPFGGNNITNDIAQCLKISMEEAEKIKLMYGDVNVIQGYENEELIVNSSYDNSLTVKRDILVEIIRARVEELLNFIHNELKCSGFYDDISAIRITGGTADLKNISELCSNILGKDVKIISPQKLGATNSSELAVIGVIKSVFETLKVKEKADSSIANIPTKSNPSKNKGSKFVTKIRDFIEELF
jgi:cell division protein FtsA